MKQDDYIKLLKCGEVMTETAAKAYVNKEFGFEFSQIRIIDRIKDQVMREPVYCSTDWNYIRFDVKGWHWECVNGELEPYYC